MDVFYKKSKNHNSVIISYDRTTYGLAQLINDKAINELADLNVVVIMAYNYKPARCYASASVNFDKSGDIKLNAINGLFTMVKKDVKRKKTTATQPELFDNPPVPEPEEYIESDATLYNPDGTSTIAHYPKKDDEETVVITERRKYPKGWFMYPFVIKNKLKYKAYTYIRLVKRNKEDSKPTTPKVSVLFETVYRGVYIFEEPHVGVKISLLSFSELTSKYGDPLSEFDAMTLGISTDKKIKVLRSWHDLPVITVKRLNHKQVEEHIDIITKVLAKKEIHYAGKDFTQTDPVFIKLKVGVHSKGTIKYKYPIGIVYKDKQNPEYTYIFNVKKLTSGGGYAGSTWYVGRNIIMSKTRYSVDTKNFNTIRIGLPSLSVFE